MTNQTWCFYDSATGLFSGASFSGDSASLAQQLAHMGSGVGAFAGEVDYLCQRLHVESGRLIEHRPEPPQDGTDLTRYAWWWDRSAKRWMRRPLLKKLKADRWGEAKEARQAALDAPLVTAYGEFDHDERARTAIATSAQACAVTCDGIAFTLADNTLVQLTAAQMNEVWVASHARLQAVRARAEDLRAAIDAALSAEVLATITI